MSRSLCESWALYCIVSTLLIQYEQYRVPTETNQPISQSKLSEKKVLKAALVVATKLDTVHSCWRQGGWSNVGWHTGLFLFCVSICRPHRTESTKNVYCSVSTDTCTGRSCTSEKCARRRGERGEGVCLLVPWSPWSWEMLRDKLARSNPRNRNQKKDSVRSFNGKAHWNFQIGPKGYSCDPGNKPFLSKVEDPALISPKIPWDEYNYEAALSDRIAD